MYMYIYSMTGNAVLDMFVRLAGIFGFRHAIYFIYTIKLTLVFSAVDSVCLAAFRTFVG